MTNTGSLGSPVSAASGSRPNDTCTVQAEGVEKLPRVVIVTSFRLSIINWLSIAGLYVPYILAAACFAAVACLIPGDSFAAHWYAYAILAISLYWFLSVKPSVYCVDFEVYKPPKEWQATKPELIETLRRLGYFTEASLSFMERMLERSGTGEATHWPPHTLRIIRPSLLRGEERRGEEGRGEEGRGEEGRGEEKVEADASISAAREMAETVMFTSLEALMKRTGLKPRDIDFLIINCSLFCPTPSLCSSVAKKFGLRSDIRSYNLGGMGCSAGLISIDLAQQLLQNRRNSIAVVISFEDITQQLYAGQERSMLLQNTLFRVGGAAIMLSNKPIDGFRAKYKLLHAVRMQDTSETAHKCVFQCQDKDGNKGVELTKDIPTVAAKTLRDNLTVLGPHVLPLREQAKVLLSISKKKLAMLANSLADAWQIKRLPFTETGRFGKIPVYIPDFKKGIQHFCIHAGGRAVIDGIEENLKLLPYHVAPSRATLKTYGNTSSSSIWYELKYVEGEEEQFKIPESEGGGHPIRAGERVVQIAFGSGFKCNSAVWLRMK